MTEQEMAARELAAKLVWVRQCKQIDSSQKLWEEVVEDRSTRQMITGYYSGLHRVAYWSALYRKDSE